jgi:hypothetical protein
MRKPESRFDSGGGGNGGHFGGGPKPSPNDIGPKAADVEPPNVADLLRRMHTYKNGSGVVQKPATLPEPIIPLPPQPASPPKMRGPTLRALLSQLKDALQGQEDLWINNPQNEASGITDPHGVANWMTQYERVSSELRKLIAAILRKEYNQKMLASLDRRICDIYTDLARSYAYNTPPPGLAALVPILLSFSQLPKIRELSERIANGQIACDPGSRETIARELDISPSLDNF